MKSFALLIFSISFVWACNGSIIKGDVTKRSADGKPLPAESEVPPATDIVPPANPTPDPVVKADPVIPPAVLGGAFLVCTPKAEGADCSMKDAKGGGAARVENPKFFIINEDLVWTEIKALPNKDGSYGMITTLAHYAIGVVTSKGEVMATWVIPPPTNMVANGSFELGGETKDVEENATTTTQGWSVATSNSKCDVFQYKIKYSPVLVTGMDGNHFVDLNSRCSSTQSYSSNVLYQDVEIVKGHYYQVNVAIAANPSAEYDQSVIVIFNGSNMASYALSQKKTMIWQEKGFVMEAISANKRMSFQDPAADARGFGALLDNVRVYDLGVPPDLKGK